MKNAIYNSLRKLPQLDPGCGGCRALHISTGFAQPAS